MVKMAEATTKVKKEVHLTTGQGRTKRRGYKQPRLWPHLLVSRDWKEMSIKAKSYPRGQLWEQCNSDVLFSWDLTGRPSKYLVKK